MDFPKPKPSLKYISNNALYIKIHYKSLIIGKYCRPEFVRSIEMTLK